MATHFYALRFPALWWFGGFVFVGLVIYGSLATGGPPMPVTYFDKLQHLVAYCFLGVYFGGMVRKRAYLVVLILLLLMSIVLEFLQGAGGHRMFDPYDMAFNALGLAAGLQLHRLGLRGWCRSAERWVLA